MTDMARNTTVVSVSLPPTTTKLLDQSAKKQGLSRSAFLGQLIKQHNLDNTWNNIFKKGDQTAIEMNITSEADIDKILHEV